MVQWRRKTLACEVWNSHKVQLKQGVKLASGKSAGVGMLGSTNAGLNCLQFVLKCHANGPRKWFEQDHVGQPWHIFEWPTQGGQSQYHAGVRLGKQRDVFEIPADVFCESHMNGLERSYVAFWSSVWLPSVCRYVWGRLHKCRSSGWDKHMSSRVEPVASGTDCAVPWATASSVEIQHASRWGDAASFPSQSYHKKWWFQDTLVFLLDGNAKHDIMGQLNFEKFAILVVANAALQQGLATWSFYFHDDNRFLWVNNHVKRSKGLEHDPNSKTSFLKILQTCELSSNMKIVRVNIEVVTYPRHGNECHQIMEEKHHKKCP